VTVALLLLQGAMEGIGLLLLVPFLDLVGEQRSAEGGGTIARLMGQAFEAVGLDLSLGTVLCVFVGLILLRSLCAMHSEVLSTEIQVGYVDHLRERLFAAIGRASWPELVRRRLSDATHGIGQDIFRVGGGARAALDLVAAGLVAAFYCAVAVYLSPRTAGAALLIGGLLELIRIPILRKAREFGEALTEVNRKAFAVATEFLQGLKLIKARGLEHRQRAKFVEAMAEIRGRRMRFTRSQQRAYLVHQVSLASGLAVLIFAATRFEVNASELLVFVFAIARLMPMLAKIHLLTRSVVTALPAYDDAVTMLRGLEGTAEPHSAESDERLALEQGLELVDVVFRYQGQDRPALDGISLSIPARRSIGVVGPSGAGKTTLVDLVLGLVVPQRGSVLVDGRPLVGSRLQAWRKSVAYLPQETFLLHDTIRANLSWMAPAASEEELWEALRSAAADEFVGRLPAGLDTVVGDRGSMLSGGERQRIALARALLCRPELLILDEATSQIDTETEHQILEALRRLRGRVAVLVVAHRASLLEQVDRLVLLDGGRVVEQASREEVLATPQGRLHLWLSGKSA